jgi:dienelactone hydrolase
VTGGVSRNEDKSSKSQFDAFAWGRGDYARDEIEGFEESLRAIIEFANREGPFDGVMGFSTGAAMALILLSIAERGVTGAIEDSLNLRTSVKITL